MRLDRFVMPLRVVYWLLKFLWTGVPPLLPDPVSEGGHSPGQGGVGRGQVLLPERALHLPPAPAEPPEPRPGAPRAREPEAGRDDPQVRHQARPQQSRVMVQPWSGHGGAVLPFIVKDKELLNESLDDGY